MNFTFSVVGMSTLLCSLLFMEALCDKCLAIVLTFTKHAAAGDYHSTQWSSSISSSSLTSSFNLMIIINIYIINIIIRISLIITFNFTNNTGLTSLPGCIISASISNSSSLWNCDCATFTDRQRERWEWGLITIRHNERKHLPPVLVCDTCDLIIRKKVMMGPIYNQSNNLSISQVAFKHLLGWEKYRTVILKGSSTKKISIA